MKADAAFYIGPFDIGCFRELDWIQEILLGHKDLLSVFPEFIGVRRRGVAFTRENADQPIHIHLNRLLSLFSKNGGVLQDLIGLIREADGDFLIHQFYGVSEPYNVQI